MLVGIRKLAEIPFDFVRKRVSVVVEAEGSDIADHEGRVSPGARYLHAVCRRHRARCGRAGRASRRAARPGASRGYACWRSPHAPGPAGHPEQGVGARLDLRRLSHVSRSAEGRRRPTPFAASQAGRVGQGHHRRQQGGDATRRRARRHAGRPCAHRKRPATAEPTKRSGAPPSPPISSSKWIRTRRSGSSWRSRKWGTSSAFSATA